MINSSYVNGTYQVGDDTRWSIDGHASHALGDAFNAGTPATVALGFTVNGERFTSATTPYNDLVSAATGLTDSNVEGSRNVQAAYVELDVPITKALDLDVSDRQDRYSDFGTTNNAKLSVRYQPVDFLTLRGAASTGFRAPTLFQLDSPPFLTASDSPTMGSGNPFCSAGNYTAEWNPTVCASQGLGLNGGNKSLTAEKSQNFDFGVIFSPIRDMGITLDYYRILLKDVVQSIPASAIYSDPTALASYITLNSSGTLTPSIQEANACNPYTQPTWTSPDGMFGGGLGNRFYSSYIDEFGTGPDNQGPQRTVGTYSLFDVYGVYKPTPNWPCYLELKICSTQVLRSPMQSNSTLRPGTTR